MATPNYFVVFEGKEPEMFSSWSEAIKHDNIEGQHYRTFPTWRETFVDFSVYKEPQQVRLLRVCLYGAPTHGHRPRPNGHQIDHTEQTIEDTVTIGTYVAANPVVDEDDEDDVEELTDGGQLPNDGHSANSPTARPSVVQPHVESCNDGLESDCKK